VLIYGGAHTYAETPLGFWLRDTFGLVRNPWDRVGHFMQGFVPAILARELLLRCTPLRRGGWLIYLVLASALSFSALFELIEWWAALVYGAQADAFLATQGDVWDTQWDMFLCLCGAALSLLLWSRPARPADRASVAPGQVAAQVQQFTEAGGRVPMAVVLVDQHFAGDALLRPKILRGEPGALQRGKAAVMTGGRVAAQGAGDFPVVADGSDEELGS
jgi:hypothetical protein